MTHVYPAALAALSVYSNSIIHRTKLDKFSREINDKLDNFSRGFNNNFDEIMDKLKEYRREIDCRFDELDRRMRRVEELVEYSIWGQYQIGMWQIKFLERIYKECGPKKYHVDMQRG